MALGERLVMEEPEGLKNTGEMSSWYDLLELGRRSFARRQEDLGI